MSSLSFENKIISLSNKEFIRKNAELIEAETESNDLFYIYSGTIRMSKVTAGGQEFTFEVATEGDIVGNTLLFSDDTMNLFSGKAIEDCWVGRLHKKLLEKELLENPAMLKEYLKWNNDRYLKTQSKFRDLMLFGRKGGLYSTLIRMTNSYGLKKPDGILIDFPITNQELGDFCGTTRESANRILNELKNKGVISIESRYITVHDLDYLRKEIYCENCPFEICQI